MVDALKDRKPGLAPRLVGHLARSGFAEALLATLLLLYSEVFYGDDTQSLTWTQFILDVVLCLGAAASGRWPRTGGIVVGLTLTATALLNPGNLSIALLALLIPLFATGSRGLDPWRTFFALWYGVVAAWTTASRESIQTSAQTVLMWVLLIALVWTFGSIIFRLQQRNVTLTQERIDAVRSQRRSIARDLHDTVAYATTTMIMRAEQLKLRNAADAQLAEDLDFIITTGRRSLRDLRGMMEALRRNDPSMDVTAADAPWRIVSLGTLLPQRVSELQAHGLEVTTSVEADLDALPESVRETLGKLVVEATSNMVKHADRSRPCRILIEETADAVEAVFTNGVAHSAVDGGEGFGLVGARERVEALGGDFETTRTHGTWLLRVSLPVGG